MDRRNGSSVFPHLTRRFWKTTMFFVLVCACAWFLKTFPRITIPMIFSYVCAVVISPLIKLVNRKRKFWLLNTVLLIITPMLLIFVSYHLFMEAYSQFSAVDYDWPKFEGYIRLKYNLVALHVKDSLGFTLDANLIDKLFSSSKSGLEMIVAKVPGYLSSIFEWVFLVPLFVFFIIKDGPMLKKKILALVPNKIFESTYYLFFQFHDKFRDYFVAKCVEAVIVGVIVFLGLVMIGVPSSFVLGILAGITNIIPYLGPIVGYLPAVILALVMDMSATQIGLMTLVFVVANIVDMFIVFPILVSKVVNLHPAIVIVSVIIGSQLGGIVGMILSVPVVAMIKLCLQEIFESVDSSS